VHRLFLHSVCQKSDWEVQIKTIKLAVRLSKLQIYLPYKFCNISHMTMLGVAGHLFLYATHAQSLLFVCDFQAMHEAQVAICKDPKSLYLHCMPNRATVELILLSMAQCAPNNKPMTATPGQLWPIGQPSGSVVSLNQ